MKNIFDINITNELITRINKLSNSTKPLWGKMDVGKMLAHCNVTYELVFENIHPKPNGIMRFMLKRFVKDGVVNEKSYQKNGQTGGAFLIKEDRKFEAEKKRLIDYLNKAQQLGENHFDGKESNSFGVLTKSEWNNMFYKHLDHHLSQFGV